MAESYDYKIIVPGEPLVQQRHRSAIRQKKGRTGMKVELEDGTIIKLFEKKDFYIHNYDPAAPDKANFVRMVMPLEQLLLGPLQVDLFLYYAYLKGHYGTGRNKGIVKTSAPLWKITKPDKDNAEKIVFDSLNGIIWKDDSQICAGETIQQYSEKPRTEIYILKLSQPGGKEPPTREQLFNRKEA